MLWRVNSAVVLGVICLSAPAKADEGVRQKVEEAVAAADVFYKAFLAGDEATVSRMTADNYIQTDVNGRVQTKAAWLEEYYHLVAKDIAAGKGPQVFERKVEDTRVLGDAVVLVGTTRLGTSVAARTLAYTQVWIRGAGGWQRAVVHNAWLPAASAK